MSEPMVAPAVVPKTIAEKLSTILSPPTVTPNEAALTRPPAGAVARYKEGGIGLALLTVVGWLLTTWFPTMPPVVVAAGTTVIVFGIGEIATLMRDLSWKGGLSLMQRIQHGDSGGA